MSERSSDRALGRSLPAGFLRVDEKNHRDGSFAQRDVSDDNGYSFGDKYSQEYERRPRGKRAKSVPVEVRRQEESLRPDLCR